MPSADGARHVRSTISVAPRGSGEPALLVRTAGVGLHRRGSRRLLRELDDHVVLPEHCGHVALPVSGRLCLSAAGSAARSPDDPLVNSVATSTGRWLLSW